MRIMTVTALAASFATPASAEWEQINKLPESASHFITSEGVFLMSDLRQDTMDGGIYYSEDKGQTWTKSDVRDYNYNCFLELNGYIFAPGITMTPTTWRAVSGDMPRKTSCFTTTFLNAFCS